jgi:hypothetical protein
MGITDINTTTTTIIIQFNFLLLRANSTAIGANYEVSTIRQMESEGSDTEM